LTIIEHGEDANGIAFHSMKNRKGESSGKAPVRAMDDGRRSGIKMKRVNVRKERIKKVGAKFW
jgi:hypothetical protein